MRDRKGVVVHVQGKENIPLKGGVVLAGNHRSISDPIFVMAAIARSRRYRVGAFLSMYELFRWTSPHTAILARLMGHIPVRRGTTKAARAKAKGLNVLRHGDLLGGFPGAGCDSDPRDIKRPWRKGMAEMAIETQSPVVMFKLINTAEFAPLGPDRAAYGGKAINWSTEVTVIFSKPIMPPSNEGLTDEQKVAQAEDFTRHMEQVHSALEYVPAAA